MKNIIVSIFLTICLSSCSVFMAASGDDNPDLGVVKRGAHREDIELQLRKSTNVISNKDGSHTVVYEYTIGNEASAGRAAGNAALDILTFGLWELAGTPIEAVQGDSYQATVVYDKNDIAQSVRTKKK